MARRVRAAANIGPSIADRFLKGIGRFGVTYGRNEVGNTMSRRGFTLVEILIVILIIGMILSIAVPAWMGIRQKSRITACAENRRVINDAKQQWALDKGMSSVSTPVQTDLVNEFLKSMPKCPEGGTYTFDSVNSPANCSIHGSD